MRNAITTFLLCFCVSLMLNMSGKGVSGAMPVAVPDERSFIFYVDNSGSMSLGFHEDGLPKMDVGVKLLKAIGNEMPDIDANIGVYTYGPHREYRRVEPFDRDALIEAFDQIPTDIKFAGRITPMGSGIQNLDKTIATLPGTVDFIVVTEGRFNAGDPPDKVVQNVYDRYKDRVCFHFISFAENPPEKAFVKNLSDLNDCSVSAEAVDLLDESPRADFIEKVFGPTPLPVIFPDPPLDLSALLADVLFPFDSAQLRVPPEGIEPLDELVRKIETSKIEVDRILVTGHADRLGSPSYNEDLSRDRAEAVREYLLEQGVEVPMEIRAMGETDPITTDCHDDMPEDELIECLQPDRRVSVDLIKDGEKIN